MDSVKFSDEISYKIKTLSENESAIQIYTKLRVKIIDICCCILFYLTLRSKICIKIYVEKLFEKFRFLLYMIKVSKNTQNVLNFRTNVYDFNLEIKIIQK